MVFLRAVKKLLDFPTRFPTRFASVSVDSQPISSAIQVKFTSFVKPSITLWGDLLRLSKWSE